MSKITFMFVKPSVDITLKNEFMPQKIKNKQLLFWYDDISAKWLYLLKKESRYCIMLNT